MQRFKALIGSTFTFIFRTHWHHIVWGAIILTITSIVLMVAFSGLLADVFGPIIELMQQSPLALQIFIPLYIIFVFVVIITYIYFLIQSLQKTYTVLQVTQSVPKQIVRMISVVAIMLVALYIPVLALSLLSYIVPSLYFMSGLLATVFIIAIIPAVTLAPVIAVKENINGYKALQKNVAIARQHWKNIFLSIIGFSVISFIAWLFLLTILDFILQGLGFVLPASIWGLLTLFSFMWAYCVYQAAITHFFVELEAQF